MRALGTTRWRTLNRNHSLSQPIIKTFSLDWIESNTSLKLYLQMYELKRSKPVQSHLRSNSNLLRPNPNSRMKWTKRQPISRRQPSNRSQHLLLRVSISSRPPSTWFPLRIDPPLRSTNIPNLPLSSLRFWVTRSASKEQRKPFRTDSTSVSPNLK